ncbi:hypothetical protein H0H87_012083 [Tephrocybe sp. NHM501043]|nr:hypothetical protein H0H87_012083 [Tephrocybe sp. NHM501043]
MSVFNIGMNDVSDQERAMKDKLASKDGHISALKSQLLKQDEELQEMKEMYNEKLRQLAGQTTRVVELENDLQARATLLSNEKMAFQNADTSLVAANATIKQRDLEVRDLEVKLDQLSRLSDEHKSRADKLAKDKTTLEARVRELNATFHQSTPMPPTTPGRPRSARSRSRSASPSRSKIIALEQEMEALRSMIREKEAEARLANEKASRAHDEQIRVGNEKTALERKMTREFEELKAVLEDKEDEMRGYTMAAEEVATREKELLDRIDEDEARYQASVKVLRSDIAKAEAKVKNLQLRVSEAEERQIQLVDEKEKVLDELEKARQWFVHPKPYLHLSSSQLYRPTNITMQAENKTAEDMSKILSAIDRLRSERNSLLVERDGLQSQLDFLQAESKFELEALRAKLTARSAAISSEGFAEDPARFHRELSELSARHRAFVARMTIEVRRLGIAAMASAVVVQHLDSKAATLALHASNAHFSQVEAQVQLSKSQSELSDLSRKLQQAETNMDLNVDHLKDNSREIEELRTQLGAKDTMLEQAISEAKDAKDAQEFYRRQYDDAESQRSSLALEVTNLTNELSGSKEDLKAAESRYAELQLHQFDAMSTTDGMRLLQNELFEERARVKRRDDHLKMLQHDIGRLETTIHLHEERLGEMTIELESMTSGKEAMVEDCEEARNARDRALLRLEQMEVDMETQAEEADRTTEALVRVVVQTVGSAKEGLRVERERAGLAEQALARLEDEYRMELDMTHANSGDSIAMEEIIEEARQSTIALAVSQLGLGRALVYIQGIAQEKVNLQQDIMMERDDMHRDAMLNEALTQQLEVLRGQAAAAALDFSHRTAELEQHIQDLQQTISENQASHDAAIEDLARSKEQLAATLQETRHALTQSSSDEDISSLREQYTTQIAEARTQLSESERALRDLRMSYAATKGELESALEDAEKAREDLDRGVAQSLQDVAAQQEVIAQREEKISVLQDELATAHSTRDAAEASLQELKGSFDHLTIELDSLQVQLQGSFTQATEEQSAAQQELEDKLALLQSQLDDRSRELDTAAEESAKLARRLEDEVISRKVEKAAHETALDDAQTQRKDAESALAQLQKEIKSTHAQLQDSAGDSEKLREEKLSLQEQITTLEAEVQKSISLKRYLESQVKESEDKVASYMGELEQVREDLARSEKVANAAEVNLSLQGAQHKREMTDLNRQLTALRSQPNLQSALAELEERNDEMEELLRKKCVEIEENDDRALEMLKENKKLTTKVESLTRKVQTLQTKLAAAKASMPSSFEAPQTNILSQSPIQPPSSGSRVADQPRSVTVTNDIPASGSSTVAGPVPTLPPVLSSIPSYAPPPASQTPQHYADSEPSSLRSKTPEPTVAPVFKARTPERRSDSLPPSETSSSSIGKKRRAPDDFEAGDGLPPQAFTVDSLPSREHAYPTTTPRARRMLSALQPGFTPVRNTSRPIVSMPSPKRLMTTKSGPERAVFQDKKELAGEDSGSVVSGK